MARCFVCDVMEAAPPGPSPQHFRQRWARPCPGCPRLAHRSCLEHMLGECVCLKEGRECARKRLPLKCAGCGKEYTLTRRFPESLPELLGATVLEWRWVLRRILVMFMFLLWLHSLAEHYSVLEGIGREIGVLMIMTASLMSISVSQRFHRGVQMIWHTPHRWHYLKLFVLIAILTYMASLRVFVPARWAGAAAQWPFLASLHEVHSRLYSSVIGTVALNTISWLYVVTTSGLVFCFWKTSLRVPTVADAGHAQGVKKSHSKCGLCQLGLCLDNTGM